MTIVPPSRLVLPQGDWVSLIDFLLSRFPRISRVDWLDRMARGTVRLDGNAVASDAPYRAGATLTYRREVAAEPRIPFDETVVHADDDLVVADKPPFLPVMPTGAHVEETLSARLIRRLGHPDLVALHRLDRETAGLVIFSARPATRDAYAALFRERRIVKVYEAWAPPMPGRVFPFEHASRLERGEPFFRMRQAPGAPNAVTRVDVIARDADRWLYRLEPVSGRKHQLRVHMATLGAPIEGDAYYPVLRPEGVGFDRPLRLLARELRFVDPLSGVERVFRSERAFC
ncbi:pseudouridine synthase [Luteibacter sp. PPL201]|uniref:Pseudouridine synthase n=1 Tax=Luteibacter sahnii TaxID=3021977 RepID=A0ABT6BCQ8_9GAMM|nr:pseudouridine synthase [Luteibacter sp. PPL193]MDY1549262.1 pseudouridine synthase [Luteibacter sp. PPL193]